MANWHAGSDGLGEAGPGGKGRDPWDQAEGEAKRLGQWLESAEADPAIPPSPESAAASPPEWQNQGWRRDEATPERPRQVFPATESYDHANGDTAGGGPFAEEEADAAYTLDARDAEGAPGLAQSERLSLGDDDVRLPWLEGDDEEDEAGGAGVGQGLLLVVLGLVALGLIVGAVLWTMRARPAADQVAQGGVIAAPKEPYKTKPENPGGEVVAGTGDTSFAVAEGQTRPAQIDGRQAAPQPGFQTIDTAKPTAQPSPAAPSAPAAPTQSSSGPGVQVGAYTSRATAEKGWTTLQQRAPALAGIAHRVVEGQADFGTVFRLQAVPGDMAAARALQAQLKAAGVDSAIKP